MTGTRGSTLRRTQHATRFYRKSAKKSEQQKSSGRSPGRTRTDLPRSRTSLPTSMRTRRLAGMRQLRRTVVMLDWLGRGFRLGCRFRRRLGFGCGLGSGCRFRCRFGRCTVGGRGLRSPAVVVIAEGAGGDQAGENSYDGQFHGGIFGLGVHQTKTSDKKQLVRKQHGERPG